MIGDNAARKSYNKREVSPFVQYGHKDRDNKFAATAEKAFNDDYGTDNVRGRISLKGRFGSESSYMPFGDENGALSLNTHAWNKEPADNCENHNGVVSTQVKPGVGYDYDKEIHRTPAEFYQGSLGAYGAIDNADYENLDNDVKNAFDNAENEFSNYVKGNYAYDNEKGWHMEESVLRKIVSESIRKVLGNNS